MLADRVGGAAQGAACVEYRVLATNKTSTMEKELNEAAEAGFRFQAVMGGETAIGGNGVVAIASKEGASKARYAYRLLATSKTCWALVPDGTDAAEIGSLNVTSIASVLPS